MGLFDKEPETTTQTSGVPSWLEGPMQNIASRAGTLSNTPMEFFPGQTYADTPASLTQGLNMQAEAARGLQPAVGGALDMFNQTIGGQYLDPAFLTQMAQPGLDRVASAVNARQNMAGGRGSSLAAEAAARGAASEMGSVINAERQRQMQALGLAPTLASFAMAPGAELSRVGGAQMALDQRPIDEAMARFNFEQEEPWLRLQRYAATINPMAAVNRVQTTTAPADNSGIGQLIGMAAGYAMGGPVGASIGGNLGGSMFGSDSVSTPSGGYGAPTAGAPWWT